MNKALLYFLGAIGLGVLIVFVPLLTFAQGKSAGGPGCPRDLFSNQRETALLRLGGFACESYVASVGGHKGLRSCFSPFYLHSSHEALNGLHIHETVFLQRLDSL